MSMEPLYNFPMDAWGMRCPTKALHNKICDYAVDFITANPFRHRSRKLETDLVVPFILLHYKEGRTLPSVAKMFHCHADRMRQLKSDLLRSVCSPKKRPIKEFYISMLPSQYIARSSDGMLAHKVPVGAYVRVYQGMSPDDGFILPKDESAFGYECYELIGVNEAFENPWGTATYRCAGPILSFMHSNYDSSD